MLNITPIYAGLYGLLSIILSLWVISKRWKHRVSIGTKGVEDMARSVRVHGNYHEYVPLALILLVMSELKGMGPNWLHALGICLLVGRLFHWYGLKHYVGANPFRFLGMNATFFTIGACSLFLLRSAL